MRVLDAIRRHPVAALTVAVAGIAGWTAAELLAPPRPPTSDGPGGHPVVGPMAALDDAPPPAPSREPRPVPLAALPRLKPGMTRAEVENVIGPPASDSLQPVTLSDGRLTYRASYELAEPDMPMTVRPIGRRPLPVPHPRPAESKSFLALEFDASKPGHPLLEVLYLDPLF